jgi:hypothetical protein
LTAPVGEDRGRWGRRGRGFGLCAVGVVVVFALCMGRPVERTDEAWFLWVAHRVARGDTLYRDVYSVTTPLSHWIAAAAVRVTGTQVATIRFLSVLCFVTSAECARRLVARVGIGMFGQVVLMGALFVAASPAAHFVALYSWLAVALAMVAWVVATSPSFPERVRWLVVGALCGAACLSKPNIGVAALLASLVAAYRPRSARRAVTVSVAETCAMFAVTVAAASGWLWATGAWSAFVSETVLNKGGYLRLRVSYLGQLGHWFHALWHRPLAVEAIVRQGVVVLPAVAVAAAVAAMVLARRARARALPALAFMAVGFVALVPRPTETHVAEAAPFLLAGMVLTWRAVDAPRIMRRTRSVVGVTVMVAVLIVAGGAFRGLASPRSTLPHFAWTPKRSNEARLRRDLATLRQRTAGTVFIVQTNAGFLYLAGDLGDPTRFDIPERTDFGPHDQQTAIEAVRVDRPRFVCLRRRGAHPLTLEATTLEQYLRRHYSVVADVGVCELRELTRAR